MCWSGPNAGYNFSNFGNPQVKSSRGTRAFYNIVDPGGGLSQTTGATNEADYPQGWDKTVTSPVIKTVKKTPALSQAADTKQVEIAEKAVTDANKRRLELMRYDSLQSKAKAKSTEQTQLVSP